MVGLIWDILLVLVGLIQIGGVFVRWVSLVFKKSVSMLVLTKYIDIEEQHVT